MLARLNWPRSLSLNPNKLIFLEIFNPFAIAAVILIDEKLPGPLFTSIENLLLIFTLCLFNKFNMFKTN